MRALTAMLLFVMIAARPVAAQEQRGAIEGLVTDSVGGVLRGVTIEARSPALVGVQTTITDAIGAYRFPALPPGIYEVRATRQGFEEGRTENIALELGQILRVPFILKPAGPAQSVEVRARAPLIDVQQNTAGTTVPREIIERVPKSRDYTLLVTSAPGSDFEVRQGGIQIDGASGSDNRFFIDGVDHTHLRFGQSLTINATFKALPNDFLEQVQAKASGYRAEYRAAIGGVISAVTKSGGNRWHASFGGYFTSDGLQGSARAQLQLDPLDQRKAKHVVPPDDDFTHRELVGDVGGPIRRDRVWVYAAYNPQATSTRRTVTFRSTGQRATFSADPLDGILTYSAVAQLADGLRGKFAVSNQRTRGAVSLPDIQTDGTSLSNPALFPSATRRDNYMNSSAGVLDWTPSARTYVNVTASHLVYDGEEVGAFSDQLVHAFSGSNFQFADIPGDLQRPSGFLDAPYPYHFVRDTFARSNVGTEVSRYAAWHGQHTLKVGLQFEHMSNNVLDGEQAPVVALNWGASYAALDGRLVTGRFGYYSVSRSWTEGRVGANNTSLFAQDAWTMGDRVTLNIGVRVENEGVPSYRPENPGVHFGFRDKFAPRIGFAWDPRGDHRWKLYGSWGLFYDLMKLNVGRVLFGADRWEIYHFTLDTPNWPEIRCAFPPSPGPACPGTFIAQVDSGPVANLNGQSLVDPNLMPARTGEITLGLDHELGRSVSIGARYVHKWADRVIEAVCDIRYVCGVNNPGFGTAVQPFGPNFPVQPVAKRVYDGLDVRLRRRLADRWSMDASYLLSRLWGNWSGLNSTDEAVRCNRPNSCTAFDLLYYSYDAAGHPTYGLLATDRPHRLKVQATYDLPWGTWVGVNYLAQSGWPRSTVMRMHSNGINFFPYGRGDMGRTPAYSQTDLLIQHNVTLPFRRARLLVGANLTNVFDQKTVIAVVSTPYRDAFSISAEQFFAGFDPKAVAAATPTMRPDPRFGLANAYQSRRSIMVQAKVTF